MMRRALLAWVAMMLVVNLGADSVRAVQGNHQASRFEQGGADVISPLVLPVARIGGNLREQPTTQSNRIEMPSGIATFEVLGDQVSELSGGTANGSNLWYHIRVGDGQEAYLHNSVLVIDQAEARAIQLYEAYLANLYLFEEQPRVVWSGQLPTSLVTIPTQSEGTLYPELVEPAREVIEAQLATQGIEASVVVLTNSLEGERFRYTLIPFVANPDGSTTVYWPLAPDGTLNWNPSVRPTNQMAELDLPSGFTFVGGFNDTTTDGVPENFYLSATLNGTPVAGIDRATKSLVPLSSFSPDEQQLIAQALAGQLEPAALAESLHLAEFSTSVEQAIQVAAAMPLNNNPIEGGIAEYWTAGDQERFVLSYTHAYEQMGIPYSENPLFQSDAAMNRMWSILLAWAAYGQTATYDQFVAVHQDPQPALEILRQTQPVVRLHSETSLRSGGAPVPTVEVNLFNLFTKGRFVVTLGREGLMDRGFSMPYWPVTTIGAPSFNRALVAQPGTPDTVFLLWNRFVSPDSYYNQPYLTQFWDVNPILHTIGGFLDIIPDENRPNQINYYDIMDFWFGQDPELAEFNQGLWAELND